MNKMIKIDCGTDIRMINIAHIAAITENAVNPVDSSIEDPYTYYRIDIVGSESVNVDENVFKQILFLISKLSICKNLKKSYL